MSSSPDRIAASTLSALARAALVAVVLATVAVAGQAATYEVRLENGNSFQTRYAPVEATFSDDHLMFLSGESNWIVVTKDEVDEIVRLEELLGFGTYLDDVTILIGSSPNDKPTPEEIAEMEVGEAVEAVAAQAPNDTMPVFSEPNAGGGIPLSFLGVTTPPMSTSSGGASFADERRNGGSGLSREPFVRE